MPFFSRVNWNLIISYTRRRHLFINKKRTSAKLMLHFPVKINAINGISWMNFIILLFFIDLFTKWLYYVGVVCVLSNVITNFIIKLENSKEKNLHIFNFIYIKLMFNILNSICRCIASSRRSAREHFWVFFFSNSFWWILHIQTQFRFHTNRN